jgi:DGQHR domain-containing protein
MPDFSSSFGLSLPALRGRQGERIIYLVMPSMVEVNNVIPPDMEPATERAQRALDPNHARAISEYIEGNPDTYVLGALTYALDREGRFEAVAEGAKIGMLSIPLDARLRCIDGQHRRHGIKPALEVVEELANDDQPIVVYVEPDLVARKQMFSDMNWTVRRVSTSVNVGFNSRDIFARAVNQLVDRHPLLAGRTEKDRPSVAKKSDKLYTLGVLYDVMKRLAMRPEKRVSTKVAETFDERKLVRDGGAFFSLLLEARPELRKATERPDLTEELRGGSIIFSGATLKMMASVVYFATQDRGYQLAELREAISQLDLSPTAKLWRETTGFVAPSGKAQKLTPSSRLQDIRAATSATLELVAPERLAAPSAA